MPPRIRLLALGSFAIGTGNFVFVGVLDGLASDLGITVATAGQLTTAFAIAYAISAPVLVALSSHLPRRPVMLGALALFTLANGTMALAPDFASLLWMRVVAAFGAALYMPVAMGVAVTLAPAGKRGRAMAVVLVGLTAAFMLGIPVGTSVGTLFGWRATFLMAAALGVAALIVLSIGIPHVAGSMTRGLRGLDILLRPVVPGHLAITVLAFTAVFCINAFIGPVIARVTGLGGHGIAMVQVVIGSAGLLGVPLGGWLADRRPTTGSVAAILAMIAVAQPVLTLLLVVPGWAGTAGAIVACTAAMLVASAALFALGPVLQQRLIDVAGDERDLVLSLNASALFLGQGLGAALGGGVIVMTSSLLANGLVGGLVAALAIALMLTVGRR